MMDPACEVNEKDTREKNDENEALEEGTSPPLDLGPYEINEADGKTLPYAEKDWENPDQIEVPKNMNRIYPLQCKQDKVTVRDGDDFVVDRIDLKKIMEELLG